MSTQYWKWKRQGICYICKTNPLFDGHSTCDACAKEQRLKQQARVASARAAGLCVKDFHRPQAKGSQYCLECLERTRKLQDPQAREEEIARRPLRQWETQHQGSGRAPRTEPTQERLL